jgi:arginyl-tRNA synthetase
MKDIYSHVGSVLDTVTGLSIGHLLESPKDPSHGDIAFPCFTLAKELGKSPVQIAQDIIATIKPDDIIASAVATGPYINFFVQASYLAQTVIASVLEQKDNYGRGPAIDETIVIESPSPNTNKPLHLWHVRNMLLGNSLDLICSFAGYKSVKVEVVNDRGIHICKSMLAYQLFGNNAEPDKKSDHFVGDRYVRFAQEVEKDPALDGQAQAMLRQREDKDPAIRALWEKMNKRASDGFQTTYARYGTRIDQHYYESDIYEQGKTIILEALEAWIFVRDPKGNIAFPLEKKDGEMGYFVVLRADGTAVYATQDIALAAQREADYHMDRMVYVVGNEQEDYFKTLFAVIKALDYPFADQCHHLSYGMIALPDGKMKSRTGNVVDADDLAQDMHEQAASVLRERYPDLSVEEIATKAESIAMAAIKFFMIKYEVAKDFVFDPAQSLSFDGETGPYMLYSYARCAQIIAKSQSTVILSNAKDLSNHKDSSASTTSRDKPPQNDKTFDPTLLQEESERKLLIHLAGFSDVVVKAAQEYKPNLIARYILELTQLFNRYYQQTQIIVEDAALQQARVALVASVQQVLGNALHLLGIETVERM